MTARTLRLTSAALVLLAAAPAAATVHLRNREVAAGPVATRPAVTGSAAAGAATESYLIAARGGVTPAWKQAVVAAGARLVAYLPDHAFLIRVNPAAVARLGRLAGVDLLVPYLAGDKLAPELAAALDGRGPAPLPLHVLIAPDVTAAAAAARLAGLGLEVVGQGDGGRFNDLAVLLPPGRLDLAERIAELSFVVWIEPRGRRVLLNDSGRWLGQGGLDDRRATPLHDHGVRGSSQTVAVLDTGLDYDMCYFRDPAGAPPLNRAGGIDFDPTRRKVVAYDFLFAGDDPADPGDYDDHSHGTHVAGSVAGDSDASPLGHDYGDGMADGARLIAQDGGFEEDDCSDLPALGCPVVDLTPIFEQAWLQGARFHSNSWGDRENFNPQNTYTAACVDADEFMFAHPDFLILFAAGNGGPGDDTVGSPATAKNVVAVGATQHGTAAASLASFSSWGNAADGRIKPTLTASGANVVSAFTDGDVTTGNCGTAAFSGTSMACPTAAGLAALAADYYVQGFYPRRRPDPARGFNPSAALVKATLINSARAMSNEPAIPSRNQGWGRITLGDTLPVPGSRRDLFLVDERAGFATGETASRRYTVEVVSAAEPLKATLVWTDPPSTPMAATNLVNDLDLQLSGPAGAFLGNVFAGGRSVAGGSPDRLNVEEQVLVASPLPGSYTIEVAPAVLPEGPQPFALVVTGDLRTPLDVAYKSHALASEMNGNGWADPGETVRLAITLVDASEAAATQVSGRLAALSPDVVVLDDRAAWPDLAPGDSVASLADHFEVTVSPAACGRRVPMALTVTASGETFVLRFELLVGGYVPVYSEQFDADAEGSLPAPWTLDTNRPGSGAAALVDATIEPVGTAPPPPSSPHALFVGKVGSDLMASRTFAARPVDLAAWAGRPARLSLSWWVAGAEGSDRLTLNLSDNAGASYPFELLRTPVPYDSAASGAGWESVVVDLDRLPGLATGAATWLRLDANLSRAESGDAFYVDDLAIEAVDCAVVGCSEAIADPSASAAGPVCPGQAVLLDASRSRPGAGCAALAHSWYEGAMLLGSGVTLAVTPGVSTRYRLETGCASPPGGCTSSFPIDVTVVPGTVSAVTANSLRGVRRGRAAELSWGGSGAGFNVAATADRTLLPLVGQPPLNPAPVALPAFAHAPAVTPGAVYYQAFGTDSCTGASLP